LFEINSAAKEAQIVANGMAFSLKGMLRGHTDLITDMVEVPTLKSSSSSPSIQPSVQFPVQSAGSAQSLPSAPQPQSIVWTSSRDMSIRVWDIDKKVLIKEIPNAHKAWIQCLCVITPTQILSGACDGRVKSWNTKTYAYTEFPAQHSKDIQSMFHSSKKGVVWVGSFDKTISLWQ